MSLDGENNSTQKLPQSLFRFVDNAEAHSIATEKEDVFRLITVFTMSITYTHTHTRSCKFVTPTVSSSQVQQPPELVKLNV